MMFTSTYSYAHAYPSRHALQGWHHCVDEFFRGMRSARDESAVPDETAPLPRPQPPGLVPFVDQNTPAMEDFQKFSIHNGRA